jgi:hypothetical protein
MAQQVFDVVLGSGEEIVGTDDVVSLRDETVTEVAPKESSTARDQDGAAAGFFIRKLQFPVG